MTTDPDEGPFPPTRQELKEENKKLIETHMDLLASFTELRADYAHLQNSENVLNEGHIRFTINVQTITPEQAMNLAGQIQKTIVDWRCKFVRDIAIPGATFTDTYTPEEKTDE